MRRGGRETERQKLPEVQQMCRELEVNNNLAPQKGKQETLPFPMAFQSLVFVIY